MNCYTSRVAIVGRWRALYDKRKFTGLCRTSSQRIAIVELPRRSQEDRFVAPGRYGELQSQIRRRALRAEIPILFIYAFDPRTRLGPFVFVDKTLIPGAPRAVGAALHAARASATCAWCCSSGTPTSGPARPASTASRRRCCWSPACRSTAPALRLDPRRVAAGRRSAADPGRRPQGRSTSRGTSSAFRPTAAKAPTWSSPAKSTCSWNCSTASWR